ncbi:MAG: hypothetical protein K0Q73_3857 [Paenibacillus sp.]|jgi:hypothetical protein|nr:hypothetical protein [Paenibacillus sp.]
MMLKLGILDQSQIGECRNAAAGRNDGISTSGG